MVSGHHGAFYIIRQDNAPGTATAMGNPETPPPRIAAIEAGGSKCLAVVGSQVTAHHPYHSIATHDPEITLHSILSFLRREFNQRPFQSIGVATFGPVGIQKKQADYGVIGPTPKVGWQGVNYVEALEEFKVPIVVDSDVNSAALAESCVGVARGCPRVIYVTVGTGIGGGIILEGRPSNGLGHPELGHMTIAAHPDDPRPKGSCSFHGHCLEGLASGAAILKRWGAPLSELPPHHPAHALTSYYIAQMCLNLTLTLMPDALVLGGGVMETPGLRGAVCQQFRNLMAGYLPRWNSAEAVEQLIRQPELAPISGLVGAALMAEAALDL